MALLRKKITASTLIESLIAMVVVMISFGVATTIYLNVMGAGKEQQKLKSRLIVEQLAFEAKKKHLFIDEKLSVGGFVVEKKVSHYKGKDNLVCLQFIVLDGNEKVMTRYNELIPVQNEIP